MVGIYLRTSTDKQENGLDSQRRALVDYCQLYGIKEYLIYEDEGISGSKHTRPGLSRLLNDVRGKKIDKVLVYSFSRFARSTRHLLDSLDEFHKLNVDFISITEKIDTTSAIGKALFTIISAISQLERELIIERVKTGLDGAKQRGIKLGRPVKYKVSEIQELLDKKHTISDIILKTKLSKATVYRVLANRVCIR